MLLEKGERGRGPVTLTAGAVPEVERRDITRVPPQHVSHRRERPWAGLPDPPRTEGAPDAVHDVAPGRDTGDDREGPEKGGLERHANASWPASMPEPVPASEVLLEADGELQAVLVLRAEVVDIGDEVVTDFTFY